MSEDRGPLYQEFESLSRMDRETSDFFEGLATALRPHESQTPSDKSPAAESVEQNEITGRGRLSWPEGNGPSRTLLVW